MTTNHERAAEVIYQALNGKHGVFSHHGEAADALAAAGVLAPELPAPNSQGESFTVWTPNGEVVVKTNPNGMIIIEHMDVVGDVVWFAPISGEASAFADMIKAAAEYIIAGAPKEDS